MSFADNIRGGIRQAACSYVGAVGAANDWLQSVIPTTPDPPFESGLRGLLCDDPTPPPQTPPPFSGGQCPGVSYRVFRESLTSGVSEQQIRNPTTYQGPISPAFTKTVGDSQFRCFTYGPNRTEKCFQGSAPGVDLDPVLSITRVERVDGQPDTCGDPVPIIPPFIPPVITVPIPNPDGQGPDIDVDVTLFAPIIIGPRIFAPVSVNGPNFEVNGQINFAPNVSIDVGLGGSGGSGGGTGVTEEPEDFDPESPEEPPQADGRRIIGIIVTLNTDLPLRATELEQDGDIGSIYVPRIAIAYLVSNNGGVRIPLSGIDLKLRNTYIPVPPDVEVVSWRIHTEQGVTVENVRPVYGSTRPVG